MLIKIDLVPTTQVTERDLNIVADGAEAAGMDLEEIRKDYLDGKIITFRVTNPGAAEEETAILLIQELVEMGEKIWLYLLLATTRAVSNIALKHNHELSTTLEEVAKSQGIKRLRALQVPKLYEHITKPVGWTISRYEVEKEL